MLPALFLGVCVVYFDCFSLEWDSNFYRQYATWVDFDSLLSCTVSNPYVQLLCMSSMGMYLLLLLLLLSMGL